jgi:diguanylate cyclase (GGDEF)-like protein
VESSLSVKKQPGTGLGLAISKGLVNALGGKIQCKSKEGTGNTFSFTLPIIAKEKRFYYILENEIAKARQYHLPLAVLIIKLKHFAHVKEVYGIKECERVLELVKEKIEKKRLKFTDKINVSRYNSEIIALIIMPDTSCSGAQIAQERITPCITAIEIAAGESKYNCSFTSGVATYPDDAKSAEELVVFAMEGLEKKG